MEPARLQDNVVEAFLLSWAGRQRRSGGEVSEGLSFSDGVSVPAADLSASNS